MSKIREQVETPTSDLDAPAEGDLDAFVIFTQRSEDAPHIYAGWLDAADGEMALQFACEHYGQDEQCVHIWAAPRDFVGGLRVNREAQTETVPERDYQLFGQREAGDQHVSGPTVRATCAAEAIDLAPTVLPGAADMHNVWAIPCDELLGTTPGDVIWRHTDQSYRLARGYSKEVRAKWQRVREARALAEYERDDLKEAFE
jgi:1,2-phenylacetyl-CoA epoxidase PaaB subunit